MKRLLLKLSIGFAVLATLYGCGSGSTETIEFEISGPCSSCPFSRLDSTLKTQKGVKGVSWDEKTQRVKIDFDPEKTSEKDLLYVITEGGYSSDLEIGLDAPSDVCCSREGSSLNLDIDNDADADLENDLDDDLNAQLEGMDTIDDDLGDLSKDVDSSMGDFDLNDEDIILPDVEEEELYKRL